jgi:hypothetical protein
VTSRLYSGLASLCQAAAMAACIVALLSFTLFAFDQVTTASQAQQSELTTQAAASGAAPASAVKPHSHVRRTLDDASTELGSPFHGITTRTDSVWGEHILQTLLVLLVYGFSLGFAARFIRVHA